MSTTYNLGRIGLNLRGDFDAAASYEKLDVVFYDGSSYAAKSACTGVLPTNADFWTLLASGTPGTVASSDDLYRLGIQAGLTDVFDVDSKKSRNTRSYSRSRSSKALCRSAFPCFTPALRD